MIEGTIDGPKEVANAVGAAVTLGEQTLCEDRAHGVASLRANSEPAP
jgi:hypothetical protein